MQHKKIIDPIIHSFINILFKQHCDVRVQFKKIYYQLVIYDIFKF